MQKDTIRAGHGDPVTKGQIVTVNWTGYGRNRNIQEQFFSTKDPGNAPFQFQIGMGNVIKAWDEGILGMRVGETAILSAPPEMCYGAGGFIKFGVLPNSPLRFEIEIVSAT